MAWNDDDDAISYRVVMNEEEQYSIWPLHKEIPNSWSAVGKEGKKAECLEHINEVWTDMRPKSLRLKMDAAKQSAK